MSNGAVQASSRKVGPFWKGLAVYVLLGPPIGCVVWLAILLAPSAIVGISIASGPEYILAGLLSFVITFVIGVPFSYVLGILPAIIVGSICMAAQLRFRSFNGLHAAAVALGFGVLNAFVLPFLYQFVLPSLYPTGPVPISLSSVEAFAIAVVSVLMFVIPTVVCWRIARRWAIQSGTSRT
jgi:hypothetical protein